MAEFRLRIFNSPWHATLEHVTGNFSASPEQGGKGHSSTPKTGDTGTGTGTGTGTDTDTLEFSSPLELVSYLEQNNTPPRGLR
jgi:hypothetical protein